MRAQSFKELLAASGADVPRTPMLSREERLTQSMPPAVVEMLEQRRLMALSVNLSGGVLNVTGNAGADSITVYVNLLDNSIYVADATNTYGPYGPSNITQYIKILAGGGNDTVKIDHSGGGTSVPEACLIYGEAGNDVVEAGDLADTVYGGDGDDNLKGFVGNDLMYGGADYDTIDGGNGDDTIRGETGGDCISGGAGSDTLYGDAGNDTLIGTGDGGFADVLDGGADTDCASIDFDIDVASNIEGFYP